MTLKMRRTGVLCCLERLSPYAFLGRLVSLLLSKCFVNRFSFLVFLQWSTQFTYFMVQDFERLVQFNVKSGAFRML